MRETEHYGIPKARGWDVNEWTSGQGSREVD